MSRSTTSVSAYARVCAIVVSTMALSMLTASAFTPVPFGATRQTPSTVLMARQNGRRYAPIVKEVKPTMNNEIEAKELRVVTQNTKGKDEPLGIMSRDEALSKAREMGGLDLILINGNADPPVCKIVDYSKFRYMQEKKAKEIKKNSKATEIKEVKMSYKIDVHDYGVRKKNASKFLSQGNRVKCTVMFRGREVQHDKLGFELLDKLAEDLSKLSTREGRPKREGRNLSLILSPRTEVLKAVNESRKADEKARKKKKEEQKKKKAEAAAAAAASASASTLGGSDKADTAPIDLEGSLESSIDDLFGADDLTDNLFN